MRAPSLITNLVELLHLNGQLLIQTGFTDATQTETTVVITAGPLQFTAKCKSESITSSQNPRAAVEDLIGETIRNAAAGMREHLQKQQNEIVVAQEGDVPPAPPVSKLRKV